MGLEIGSLTRLPLGYVGESGTRVIEIHVSSWLKEFPGSKIVVEVVRPDEKIYFAPTTLENGILRWTVGADEVMVAGRGYAQFAVVNVITNKEYRSRIVETIIAPSLEEFTKEELEASDPANKWANQVIAAASAVQDVTGDLRNLNTQNKSNLVAAINEVKASGGSSGGSGGSGGITITGAIIKDGTVSEDYVWSSKYTNEFITGVVNSFQEDIDKTIRYDIDQSTTLTDGQKAQARANIGITSSGVDISGLIDDSNLVDGEDGSSEKVWSSRKSSALKDFVEVGLEAAFGTTGDKAKLTTNNKSDLVSAINEVNSKVGSGGSSGTTPPTDELRVECWGDSLTFGAGAPGSDWAYREAYPAVLGSLLTGHTVCNYGVGEENSETILARMGTTPMFATNQFSIGAAAGAVSTIKLASATGAEVKPLRQIPSDSNISGKDKGVNPVTISGIEGTLSYDSTLGYVFSRTSDGDSTPILLPTEVVTAYKRMDHDNRVRIIWMGQNDILDTTLEDIPMLTQYLIEACRAAIRGVDKYIILTAPVSTGATAAPYKPIHRAMVHAFGDHCINIVDYLINFGLADAGLTAKTQDSTDIANYFIPDQLRSDKVHLNSAGYAVVARQVYKRGKELGYW